MSTFYFIITGVLNCKKSIKLVAGFILLAFAFSCSLTKPVVTDYQFLNELEYSRRLYHEPIDILKNEHKNANDAAQSEPRIHHKFYVQIYSFKNQQNAKNAYKNVITKYPSIPFTINFSDGLWRIRTDHNDRNDAQKMQKHLHHLGFRDAWLTSF